MDFGFEQFEDCGECLGVHPMNAKYLERKERMLKTLNQRVLMKEGGDSHLNPQLQVEKDKDKPIKVVGKKEKIIKVPQTPQTDNVDDLVSMIEGTKISTDPKKLAKRARQKEQKLQKEEDERRLKLAEEKRRSEEQRKKEEEERLRLEELERLERERLETVTTKKTKKKKNKNNAAKNVESPVIVAAKETPLTSNNVCESSVLANKADKKKQVEITPSKSAIDVFLTEEKSETSSQPAEMIIICRQPSVLDTTITISMKSNSGQEELLYTLVNGQRCKDNVGTVDITASINSEGEKLKTNKKKKKKKGKDSADNLSNTFVTEIPGTNNLANGSKSHSSTIFGDLRTIDTGKLCGYMNTLAPDQEIDLTKLKLPPCITIKKLNQPVTTNRGYLGGLAESTNDVTVQNSSEHYNMNGSSPTYYNEVFKKPSVIDVDSHASKPNNDFAGNDDFLCRQEIEKFEEVVSAKTKRMRKRAQRRDGDDYDDSEYCNGDGGESVETGVSEFGTKYRPRPATNYPKKTSCRQKLVSTGNSSVSTETKSKASYGQANTSHFPGRNYVNPARILRSHQKKVIEACGDEEPSHYNVQGRNSGGVFNHPFVNVIRRYVEAREQMNGGSDMTSDSYHRQHNLTRNSNSSQPNPVGSHPNYTQMSHEASATNSTLCSADYRGNQLLDTRSCQLNIAKQPNDGDCIEDASSFTFEDRWKSANGKGPNVSGCEVPNVSNRWDAFLKESYGSTFGPFTVQAEDRQTWSPWGKLSGTEASSPDQSSRPQSCDMLISEMKVDNNGSTYLYQPSHKASCSSPVERPNPIGVAPPRDSLHQNRFPQSIKKQCYVNPIARPSSRSSRPDSMLSNRSSAEDLPVDRIPLPSGSPAVTNTLQGGGNSNDNRIDCSGIALEGLGSGAPLFGMNKNYFCL